jgi:hypothetical protein
MPDIDPDKRYPLSVARQWFSGPDGEPVHRHTLLQWCSRYNVVPGRLQGFFYLTGEQIATLLNLTTLVGPST